MPKFLFLRDPFLPIFLKIELFMFPLFSDALSNDLLLEDFHFKFQVPFVSDDIAKSFLFP